MHCGRGAFPKAEVYLVYRVGLKAHMLCGPLRDFYRPLGNK